MNTTLKLSALLVTALLTACGGGGGGGASGANPDSESIIGGEAYQNSAVTLTFPRDLKPIEEAPIEEGFGGSFPDVQSGGYDLVPVGGGATLNVYGSLFGDNSGFTLGDDFWVPAGEYEVRLAALRGTDSGISDPFVAWRDSDYLMTNDNQVTIYIDSLSEENIALTVSIRSPSASSVTATTCNASASTPCALLFALSETGVYELDLLNLDYGIRSQKTIQVIDAADPATNLDTDIVSGPRPTITGTTDAGSTVQIVIARPFSTFSTSMTVVADGSGAFSATPSVDLDAGEYIASWTTNSPIGGYSANSQGMTIYIE